jgi:RNA polymerase sigma-70 factor (ECF subfamily)
MEHSDSDLLSRYKGGDVNALSELVEKYRRPLFAYMLGMTEKGGDVDELFQEVWLRVIRKLHAYKQRSFYGWLIRIAHNLIIDRARRCKPDYSLDAHTKDEGLPLAEKIPDGHADAAALAADGDLGKRIAAAVSELPMAQREVFLMRAHSGLSFKEIASIQKVSINTALARMQYALAKLRTLLESEYHEL